MSYFIGPENDPRFSEQSMMEMQWAFALSRVERFKRLPMIHRTNDYTHSVRVGYFTIHLATEAKKRGVNIDVVKARRMALRHDDPEIFTDDIPAPSKRAMTDEQRQQLKRDERNAIEKLVEIYIPVDFRGDYLEDQAEIEGKQTTEAQIVDIADKLDAICEAIHEIRCGNEAFYEVIDYYHNGPLDELREYPVWNIVKNDPRFMLDNIPSTEEVKQTPKVTLDDLAKGKDAFWKAAMDPNVPDFYDTWRTATIFMFHEPGAGRVIFRGWDSEIERRGARVYSPFDLFGSEIKL